MNFCSVNGQSKPVSFEEVIFRSLAPDGGLYVPESIPRLPTSFLENPTAQSLHGCGVEVASLFWEIPRGDLMTIVNNAWDFPIPLVHLEDDLYLLELFHGPTLAFKDIGARFMAGILSFLLVRNDKRLTILVATSGDTGSAVAHGFFGMPNVDVVILYPSNKISRLQEQQMTTLGGNVRALEVNGTFDDCQRLAKHALADSEITKSRTLTSANSINLARLLPQATYFVWGIAQWQNSFMHDGNPPTVVVPSGNFGNITAAVYAKWMGAGIGKCIAATNINDVVPEYLKTGNYSPRPSKQTLSNAMDVGNPSNLPRLQFLYKYDLAALTRDLAATRVTDEETLDEIRRTYEHTGMVIDPHTAVGVAAARRLGRARPAIVAATAHPAKFPEIIRNAIGREISLPPSLESALQKPKQSIRISNDPRELRRYLLE